MTEEITREYLNSIGFNIEFAKNYDVARSFSWARSHEGLEFWALPDMALTPERKAKIDEMIRVWEGKEPNPETVANQELLAAAKFALEHAVADDMDEWYRRLKLAVVAAGA